MGGRDLAPRRRQGRLRWSHLLVILIVLAALGYAGDRYVWPHLRSSKPSAVPAPCRTPKPAPLPAAKTVSLRVRNSTLREGLASRVGAALHRRGFHVHGIGNTAAKVTGTATVRYSPDRALQARTLAAQVSAPVLVRVAGKRVLDLDLGPKWHALASPTAARNAARAERAAIHPAPICPTATATPSSG
jgi:LytR cell envelope-related transcriptional attenuator